MAFLRPFPITIHEDEGQFLETLRKLTLLKQSISITIKDYQLTTAGAIEGFFFIRSPAWSFLPEYVQRKGFVKSGFLLFKAGKLWNISTMSSEMYLYQTNGILKGDYQTMFNSLDSSELKEIVCVLKNMEPVMDNILSAYGNQLA